MKENIKVIKYYNLHVLILNHYLRNKNSQNVGNTGRMEAVKTRGSKTSQES